MGKYMRKRKTRKGKVAVLDDVSPVGVSTRAKTLALQQLQKSNSAANGDGGGCYLELRSRRLEKKKPFEVKRRKHPLKALNLDNSVKGKREIIQGYSWNSVKKEQAEDNSGGVEASFGENLMESERTTRESTPCNLIKDPDNIQTPGSSTRLNNASEANGRVPNSARRNIPTTHEMNDFFAGSEKKQQKQFIEKYNFDPVNDKPFPGRYEWVKLDR
ncbi:unnamed protein product [Withania somnifera]